MDFLENPLVVALILGGLLLALSIGRYTGQPRHIDWERVPYAEKCKRRRADGSTPCLCCPGECVGAAEERHPDSVITPVCPLCGKIDDEHPFIRHAISCHRADCDDAKG